MLRIGIGVALAGALLWFVYQIGYDAHKREIETAIQETNKSIDDLAKVDAAEHEAERAADSNAEAALNKHVSTMQSCALDKETASVLNSQGVSP